MQLVTHFVSVVTSAATVEVIMQHGIHAECVHRMAVMSVAVVRCCFYAGCVCLHSACYFFKSYMTQSATSRLSRLPTI